MHKLCAVCRVGDDYQKVDSVEIEVQDIVPGVPCATARVFLCAEHWGTFAHAEYKEISAEHAEKRCVAHAGHGRRSIATEVWARSGVIEIAMGACPEHRLTVVLTASVKVG